MPDFKVRKDGVWDVYFLQARDPVTHKPTITTVWNEYDLKKFENQDPVRYASQAMNDPTTSVFSPLTRSQIEQLIVDGHGIPFRNLSYTIHMDTAFKSTESQSRGDESVIQLWGHYRDGSGDVVFCGAWSAHKWRIEHFQDRLVKVVQECKTQGKRIRLMTDEPEIGGKQGTWEVALRSAFHAANVQMPPFIPLQRGNKKKISRIVMAAGYWVDGHVKLVRDAPGLETLIDQMSKIGSSAHDDYADAAADVFHKDVYNVMHRAAVLEAEENLDAPWDFVLKDAASARAVMYQMADSIKSDVW